MFDQRGARQQQRCGRGAPGSAAARDALVVLLAGLIAGGVRVGDPLLTDSLIAAATSFTEAHLHEPDLAPAMIARALCVSVRTLHRAFATTDETLMAYVRRRRLERARDALRHAATVAQVAERWHFADTSHFRRAYKAQFGHPPRTASNSREAAR
ncbi:helix-turn-helix domain-containing protein [Nocardia sp. NPDC020380]|uniref:helix-turn-helix domain-containing protein n=1 Tax=Nocardia sp. NPDC020380 TaxID=3364309 RepID=UPI0037AADAA4